MPSQVERYANLFRGLGRAFNILETERAKQESGGSQPFVRREKVELSHYEWHLNGYYGLGINPVNDDDQCHFAALDVDLYGSNYHAQLSLKVREYGGIVCVSKSRGAHVFFFFTRPASAEQVRDKLAQLTGALGLSGESGKAEVFPRQHTLRGGTEDQPRVGNFIQLPMRGGLSEDGALRGFYKDGEVHHKLDDFLNFAESLRQSPEKFLGHDTSPREGQGAQLFANGPPCLASIADQGGFGDHSRNNGMLNVALFLIRKVSAGNADDEAWEDEFRTYNERLCHPPLEETELQKLISSAKKQKTYTCNKAPIESFCQRSICIRRKFGVNFGSATTGLPYIDDLVKETYENPLYSITVGEVRMERLTIDDIEKYARFRTAALKNGVLLPPSSPKMRQFWEEELLRLHESMTVIEPRGVRGEREFFANLAEAFARRTWGETIDDPVHHALQLDHAVQGTDGHSYFNIASIISFVSTRGVRIGVAEANTVLVDLGYEPIKTGGYTVYRGPRIADGCNPDNVVHFKPRY